MQVVFRSNLDLVQQDIWSLNQIKWDNIPRVGERIQFEHCKKTYELQVCAVTYALVGTGAARIPECVVELHIPSYWGSRSITDWEEWFKKHIGNR